MAAQLIAWSDPLRPERRWMRAGDDLLARARLAEDHARELGRRDALDVARRWRRSGSRRRARACLGQRACRASRRRGGRGRSAVASSDTNLKIASPMRISSTCSRTRSCDVAAR